MNAVQQQLKRKLENWSKQGSSMSQTSMAASFSENKKWLRLSEQVENYTDKYLTTANGDIPRKSLFFSVN